MIMSSRDTSNDRLVSILLLQASYMYCLYFIANQENNAVEYKDT